MAERALRAQIIALSKRIIPSGDTRVAIVGYSDSVPKPSAKPPRKPTKRPIVGVAVSRRRALAVDAFLRRQFAVLHITGVTISVSGRGSANPVASNRTPAGRAKNRRVVVTLSGGL